MSSETLGERMGSWVRHVLSCCDRDEEEEERPAPQISGPTNFRREDITIPGLNPEQQRFIREKAISDAQKMWSHLQPLQSSPSSQFASPISDPANILPSYEDFTTPRSAPSPTAYRSGSGTRLDRVRAHSRKISNSLTKPLGYHAVGGGEGREDSKYEMRALMDPSRVRVVSAGKLSGESFSVAGSEAEDGDRDLDSRKGVVKI